MAISGSNHTVSLKPSVQNLAADVLVGYSDNHAVLGRVVLVLGLDNKTLASIVISLALPAPAELDLEPLEVGLVLDNFDERLLRKE